MKIELSRGMNDFFDSTIRLNLYTLFCPPSNPSQLKETILKVEENLSALRPLVRSSRDREFAIRSEAWIRASRALIKSSDDKKTTSDSKANTTSRDKTAAVAAPRTFEVPSKPISLAKLPEPPQYAKRIGSDGVIALVKAYVSGGKKALDQEQLFTRTRLIARSSFRLERQ